MKKIIATALAGTVLLGLSACDVDQTEEGDLPEVNVEGGNLPEFDVEPADVDVETGTETRTVEVPTLDVDVNQDDAAGEPVTEAAE